MSPSFASRWSMRLQRAWLMRGPLAVALWPLSFLFGSVTLVRTWLHRSGLLRSHAARVPVVVVGNLIVGGAGKTPVVIAVVEVLRRHGYAPGIVSRGYGRAGTDAHEVQRDSTPRDCGDEPLLLHVRTRAPVVVASDRVAAVERLLAAHPEVDVVVSDDGLQHLRLARNAQVLVFDERGAGNGWLLPAGPLRERIPARVPPRTLVVYNASSATTRLPGTLATRGLAGALRLADWWAGRPATIDALDALRARPLVAAAGIAQPERFFAMLRAHSLRFTPLPLADHHDYAALPWPADTADVIVTEKDAIKLAVGRVDLDGQTRVWVAPLDFALGAAFDAALIALLPPPGTSDGNASA